MELDTIYNMDCMEGMKGIADGSIDMILCDLPYGTTENKWDTPISLDDLWQQYERILAPTSSVVLFANGKFEFALAASKIDWFKYKWVWVKNTTSLFAHAKNRPMSRSEDILVFSPNSVSHASRSTNRMKYNPQGVHSCRPEVRNNALSKFGKTYGQRKGHKAKTVKTETGYPSDILYYDTIQSFQKKHPSQKPVPLCEYLIRTYTNEGETVLDNCMGSGTTAVAAINTGRHFIGFEKEKEYFDIAMKRIEDAQAQTRLAL